MGKHTSRVVGAKYRNAPEWLVQQLRDRREITPEGCWLWPAYINPDGYGVVMYTAHREDGTAYRPQLMVNAAKTHCDNNHLFDERNTYIAADGSRSCRECKRLWSANARAVVQLLPWTGEPRCRACGTDISHRPAQARFCELCTPVTRVREAARLQLTAEGRLF